MNSKIESHNKKNLNAEKAQYHWFQYHKDHRYPIFIKFKMSEHTPVLSDFLEGEKWVRLNEQDLPNVDLELTHNKLARVLTLTEASVLVAKKIESQFSQSQTWKNLDKAGGDREIIHKEAGHQVYRYKNVALMVYSYLHQHWEMGIMPDFGHKKSLMESRVILSRYVSWSLAPMGVVGFFGVPVDEGIVIQKPHESRGEVVYIDLANKRVLTQDGAKKMFPRFRILRLDATLRNRDVKMTSEELLSFMANNSSFLSVEGLSIPVRQILQNLSKSTEGVIHPLESFKPRMDLKIT